MLDSLLMLCFIFLGIATGLSILSFVGWFLLKLIGINMLDH